MVGIYKITSPSGKIYIGQSMNIGNRSYFYEKLRCKGQPYLYHSLLKYGWANHKFEVIHELPLDISRRVLNDYERLYISFYRGCGVNMLNIADGGYGGGQPPHIAKKISESNKGRKVWNKGIKGLPGHPHTKEAKLKISINNKGKKLSEESLIKMCETKKAHPLRITEKQRAKMDAGRIAKGPRSEESRSKTSESIKLHWEKRKQW